MMPTSDMSLPVTRKRTHTTRATTPHAVCAFTVPMPTWCCPAARAWDSRTRVRTTTTADRKVRTYTMYSGFTGPQCALVGGPGVTLRLRRGRVHGLPAGSCLRLLALLGEPV